MEKMTEADIAYAQGLGASDEVSEWCKTVLLAQCRKSSPSVEEKEHIIDYLISPVAPKRLRKMSYEQAKKAAAKWSEANQKKGRDLVESSEDIKTLMKLADGAKIVKLLTKKAYEREGFLMRHCLGGYTPGSSEVFSLRDKKNEPHVTFEVTKNGDTIQQVKGKGNGSIHPKYIDPTLAFLKKMGVEVRPSEMANLGYYHVSEKARAIMNLFVDSTGKGPVYSHVGGETYIFERRS